MGRQLEFKQRVHLPMDVALEPRVSRPLNPAYLGAILWCAVLFAGYHGLQRWLARQDLDIAEVARAKVMLTETNAVEPRPRAAREIPRAAAPVVLPPLASTPRPLPPPQTGVLSGGLPDQDFADDADRSTALNAVEPQEDDEGETPPRRAAVAGTRKPPRTRPARAPRTESRTVAPRVSMSHIDEPPIASWAERSPAPNVSSVPPSPPPTVEPPPPIEAGASCEGAVAKYNEEINIERPGAVPDISAETYAGILNNGSYFAHCGIPAHVRVHICAAVQRGRAIGVTVRTNPTQREGERCVRSAVRRLRFPYHPKLDVTRTDFAPN